MRKSLLVILLAQYTENSTRGDYYTRVVQVVGYSGEGQLILLSAFYYWTLWYITSCKNLTILVRNQIVQPLLSLNFACVL